MDTPNAICSLAALYDRLHRRDVLRAGEGASVDDLSDHTLPRLGKLGHA